MPSDWAARALYTHPHLLVVSVHVPAHGLGEGVHGVGLGGQVVGHGELAGMRGEQAGTWGCERDKVSEA